MNLDIYLTEISQQSVEVQAVFFLRLTVKFESEEIEKPVKQEPGVLYKCQIIMVYTWN